MSGTRTETTHAKNDVLVLDGASSPPPYSQGQTFELRAVTSATSSSSSLPIYEDEYPSNYDSETSGRSFRPTKTFQVESRGLPVFALPLPPQPIPIEVYAVTDAGTLGAKAYESVRPKRSSGSCVLFRGDPATASAEPVCTTTYRFGPNRPPKMRLLAPGSGVSLDNFTEQGASEVAPGEDEFEVACVGCTTRAVVLRARLGTFRWRYAGRAEGREAGAASLLVMEQVTTVALAGGRKTEERRRRVAQLVRNDECRTEGSGRSSAGNGGRLAMDLRGWDDDDADGKGAGEQMEALVVAGCICMLKKEMDRRRLHQSIVIAGAASGGS